ncbi:unnamed protein product [Symbiodinium sp. CCMP2592]|nr:unnamed protein product [Symbiodinium sp. CCMP2592]
MVRIWWAGLPIVLLCSCIVIFGLERAEPALTREAWQPASTAIPSSTRSAEAWTTEMPTSTTVSDMLPTEALISLRGKNLILAGDSNDRNFFHMLCYYATGKSDQVQYIRKLEIASGEYAGRITWATEAATMTCHDRSRNASLMFLFHQGVYSLPPQPDWFLEFVQRRLGTHGIGVRGKARVIPTTDLARDIWPEAIQQNLPMRPMVLLIQSSMWDSFPVLEKIIGTRVSQMTDEGEAKIKRAIFCEENLTEWGWLGRAEQILSAFEGGLRERGWQVSSKLWRTNPNCPALPKQGSVVANPLSELYADAVKHAILAGGAWSNVCLVDWRGHLRIDDASQCDHHHYTKAGYMEYLDALGDCLLLA